MGTVVSVGKKDMGLCPIKIPGRKRRAVILRKLVVFHDCVVNDVAKIRK